MPLKRSKGLAIMNLCMAATYDPDPRAPLGFRIPFNAESGEPGAEGLREESTLARS